MHTRLDMVILKSLKFVRVKRRAKFKYTVIKNKRVRRLEVGTENIETTEEMQNRQLAKEMIKLSKEYYDKFNHDETFRIASLDTEKLYSLIKKSVETGKDYLNRYRLSNYDPDEWLDKTIKFITEQEGFYTDVDIDNILTKLLKLQFYKQQLFTLDVPEMYGVLHHLYVLAYTEVIINGKITEEVDKWIEQPLDILVRESFDYMYLPIQVNEMYNMYEDVYSLAEKVHNSEKIEKYELKWLNTIPSKIDELRDNLDLEYCEYRYIDDVDSLFDTFKEAIESNREYVISDGKSGQFKKV